MWEILEDPTESQGERRSIQIGKEQPEGWEGNQKEEVPGHTKEVFREGESGQQCQILPRGRGR